MRAEDHRIEKEIRETGALLGAGNVQPYSPSGEDPAEILAEGHKDVPAVDVVVDIDIDVDVDFGVVVDIDVDIDVDVETPHIDQPAS